MNKNKLYTIGLIAGSLFATSCDDRVDCGCDCNMPKFNSWEILKPGVAKNADGTVASGTAIVVYGSNLTDVTEISFNGVNAELQPAFMEDGKIIFQVPDGISKDCIAHVATASCAQGFDVDLLKVVVAPPCVTMCDNEMAEKTLNVYGNSLFAPLTAKFWDGEGHTIEASTKDGTIAVDNNAKRAKIQIPEGVVDGGTIVFESEAGESETSFRFRDTRNMLITHDDPEYLDLFNQNKPDIDFEDKEEALKTSVDEGGLYSENNTTNFSVFWSNLYTSWTYSPVGEANPEKKAPKYSTPFGCFSESIASGETTFYDYVIKFEVLVNGEHPINGNGLAIGFFNDDPWGAVRQYCAFWQPSKASFAKDADGVWQQTCTCDDWTSGGDWLTITVPLEEIKYDFASASYPHCAQDNRVGVDDEKYKGFGDKENGVAFFDQPSISKLAAQLTGTRTKAIQSLGFIFGSDDQPNKDHNPWIGIDNLRIVPKDDNGGVWPLLKWGQSTRDFYTNPVLSCK